jgi:hypothetical protein
MEYGHDKATFRMYAFVPLHGSDDLDRFNMYMYNTIAMILAGMGGAAVAVKSTVGTAVVASEVTISFGDTQIQGDQRR